MAPGRIAGHLGNSSRPAVPPGPPVGIAGVQEQIAGEVAHGLGRTRPSGYGTLRVKPNIPGEDGPSLKQQTPTHAHSNEN